MKKFLFKVLLFTVAAICLLPLFGCNGYVSSYKAIALVRTNTTKHASMSFSNFEGNMVFKLKCENGDEKIYYSAQLESGDTTVYCDCNGTKTRLFTISSNGDISDVGGTLQKGTLYIIVEASDAVKSGKFNFDVK